MSDGPSIPADELWAYLGLCGEGFTAGLEEIVEAGGLTPDEAHTLREVAEQARRTT